MTVPSFSFHTNLKSFVQVSFFWKVVINLYHISFTPAEECKQVASSVGRNATRFCLYMERYLCFISLTALICIIHLSHSKHVSLREPALELAVSLHVITSKKQNKRPRKARGRELLFRNGRCLNEEESR